MSSPNEIRTQFLRDLATRMVSEKLFTHIPSIVFCMKDLEGRYVAANPAFASRLGLRSVHELIGKRADTLFPLQLARTYLEQDAVVFASERPVLDRLELIYTRKGRSIGWHLATKIPLFDHAGKIHGLASISRDLQQPRDEDLELQGLAKVTDHVQAHYSDSLKTNDLARIAGLSPTQFERRMRRIFQLSSAQYVRKIRIENAAHLLLKTQTPLVDVALECGYSDQTAFCRQFKHAVGLSPGQYRQTYRNP